MFTKVTQFDIKTETTETETRPQARTDNHHDGSGLIFY